MEAFFVLYALTISLELILSLVMAIFLYLIMAPAGAVSEPDINSRPSRPLARSAEGALSDAFASVSEGRDDLATITNARAQLVRYRDERSTTRDAS